jgi:hypothetical protein
MVAGNKNEHSSASCRQIEQWFRSVSRPYGMHDILTFNSMYGLAYRSLKQEERQLIESEIVETLIDGVANPKLKARIFGVC